MAWQAVQFAAGGAFVAALTWGEEALSPVLFTEVTR
jgi:hypothetical protein